MENCNSSLIFTDYFMRSRTQQCRHPTAVVAVSRVKPRWRREAGRTTSKRVLILILLYPSALYRKTDTAVDTRSMRGNKWHPGLDGMARHAQQLTTRVWSSVYGTPRTGRMTEGEGVKPELSSVCVQMRPPLKKHLFCSRLEASFHSGVAQWGLWRFVQALVWGFNSATVLIAKFVFFKKFEAGFPNFQFLRQVLQR